MKPVFTMFGTPRVDDWNAADSVQTIRYATDILRRYSSLVANYEERTGVNRNDFAAWKELVHHTKNDRSWREDRPASAEDPILAGDRPNSVEYLFTRWRLYFSLIKAMEERTGCERSTFAGWHYLITEVSEHPKRMIIWYLKRERLYGSLAREFEKRTGLARKTFSEWSTLTFMKKTATEEHKSTSRYFAARLNLYGRLIRRYEEESGIDRSEFMEWKRLIDTAADDLSGQMQEDKP